MRRVAFVIALCLAARIAPAAEWVIGAEGDNRHTYTYLSRVQRKPLGRGEELVFSATVSYLRYSSSGVTVSSPGLGGTAEYRIFSSNYSISGGGGYQARYTQRRSGDVSENKIEQGPLALANATFRIAQQTWIGGNASYSGANEWLAGGVQVKQGLSATLRVGAEAGWQGNSDIKIRTQGGLIEIPAGFEHTWVQVRAGTATIRDRNGNKEQRPYYSVGIARSF
jgi:hypothetical protein